MTDREGVVLSSGACIGIPPAAGGPVTYRDDLYPATGTRRAADLSTESAGRRDATTPGSEQIVTFRSPGLPSLLHLGLGRRCRCSGTGARRPPMTRVLWFIVVSGLDDHVAVGGAFGKPGRAVGNAAWAASPVVVVARSRWGARPVQGWLVGPAGGAGLGGRLPWRRCAAGVDAGLVGVAVGVHGAACLLGGRVRGPVRGSTGPGWGTAGRRGSRAAARRGRR